MSVDVLGGFDHNQFLSMSVDFCVCGICLCRLSDFDHNQFLSLSVDFRSLTIISF